MKRHIKTLVVFVCLSLVGTTCFAWDEVAYLTVYSHPSGSITGENRTGYFLNLVQAVLDEMGDSSTISFVPWARGVRMMLEAQPRAMFPMFRTREREKVFQWGGPIARLQWGLFALDNSTARIDSIEEARKASAIGVVRDDSRVQFLQKLGFDNLDLASDQILNLRKLIYGRVELIVFSQAGANALKKNPDFSNLKLRPAVEFEPRDLYVAFSRSVDPAYVLEWNAALKRLRQRGERDRIKRD